MSGTVEAKAGGADLPETTTFSFGDLLRQYRIAAGLTQETLAERARMSVAAIGKLERGVRQRPYRATINLLAEALSLSPNDRVELERAAHRGAPAALESAQNLVESTINLPVHFSSFVGRERELAKVAEMLATQRLVTLLGAGGVGKTRLAVRAAEHFIAANSTNGHLDGVWFVDLSAVTDPRMTMAAIASSTGIEQCRSLDTLLRYLRSERFLLILDNCEHLAGEVGHLTSQLLRHCSNAQILATSRQAIGIEGERIYRVAPLSLPSADAELSLDDALEFSAIRLFVDRAEAADSRFELIESTIPEIVEICRRVDGIALAIELAAARTSAFSTATIAKRLDEHFLVFAGGTHASLSRHRTMQAVFDWSYDLLDDRERYVFRGLSIFTSGFTLDLATSLWTGEIEANEVVEILASLVDKSLVQSDPRTEPPRYKLLEPARQYAREKLRESGEQNCVARAHALALLTLAETFDSKLELISDREWDAYVERERENFRTAVEWALGSGGDPDVAQRLAGSRTAMWCGVASGEVQEWVDAALRSCDVNTSSKVRAKLELIFARTGSTFGADGESVLAAAHRALELQEADDLPALASAQYILGRALQDMSRFDEADAAFREALRTSRSCGAQTEYAFATKALAAGRVCVGDLNEARKLIAETLRIHGASGSDRHAANAKLTAAEIEFEAGCPEKALRLNEEAAEFFRTHKEWMRLANTLSNAAPYLLALKRYAEARNRAHEALRWARTVGQAKHVLCTLQHLAAIAIFSNDRDGNEQSAERAATILGFVDEAFRKRHFSREYGDEHEYQETRIALREMLGESNLDELMTAGKALSEEQAVAEALVI